MARSIAVFVFGLWLFLPQWSEAALIDVLNDDEDWTFTLGGKRYGVHGFTSHDGSDVSAGTLFYWAGTPYASYRSPFIWLAYSLLSFISIALIIVAFVGAYAMLRCRGLREEADEATKPVEPTGTSSFSSDLITSHTSGDSPGGSLRR